MVTTSGQQRDTRTARTPEVASEPSTMSSTGRERILDVAARSFLRHGYEGTSLRQLADTVGMKAGSLYYHFASKEELFVEVLRRGITVMEVAFEGADANAHDSPAEQRLEDHVRAHLAALFENGPYTAAHVTTFRTAPDEVRDEIIELRDGYEARWAHLLGELRSAGQIAPTTDLTIARLALFGAMNTSVEWFDPTRTSLDEFAHILTTQFWNGVAA